MTRHGKELRNANSLGQRAKGEGLSAKSKEQRAKSKEQESEVGDQKSEIRNNENCELRYYQLLINSNLFLIF
jgi:hypothetical protein